MNWDLSIHQSNRIDRYVYGTSLLHYPLYVTADCPLIRGIYFIQVDAAPNARISMGQAIKITTG